MRWGMLEVLSFVEIWYEWCLVEGVGGVGWVVGAACLVGAGYVVGAACVVGEMVLRMLCLLYRVETGIGLLEGN